MDAKEFAVRAHGDQKYGPFPYSYHLDKVAKKVLEFQSDGESLFVAMKLAYLHDVVEDTKVTLEDIEKEFGTFIRDCVDVLTDEPGPSRKVRKDLTIAKFKEVPKGDSRCIALFVKGCDRMANIDEALIMMDRDTLKMYAKEGDSFLDAIEGKVSPKLWEAMCDQMYAVEAKLSRRY